MRAFTMVTTKSSAVVAASLAIAVNFTSACRGGDKSSSPPAPSAASAPSIEGRPSATRIAFIEDDYARAIKEAAASGKPIFADTWASWCHSCLSMKHYVLPAPEMQVLANDFVWLSIDSENQKNADFLERFPSTSIPTLWVIDPATERAVLKWSGAATAPELVTLLKETAAARSQAAVGEAATAALRGDQAAAAEKPDDAIAAYREALAKAPLDWPRRPRVIEALSLKLSELEKYAECVELAAAEISRLPPGTPLANLLMNGLGAAAELPAAAPASQHVPRLIREALRIAESNDEAMLLDDRSGIFKALVAAVSDKPAEVKRLARLWAKQLEAAASKARDAESRAVWDPHRLEAYIALGEIDTAIPMLEQSARDFPNDYNPPARLARAYYELHRYEPAMIEVTRALERASGPRKIRFYMLKADILEAKNERAAARSTIGEAIGFAAKLRLPPNYRKLKDKLSQRYAQLG
jgi:thiol-disulfide isomerase/thioredoxin